MNHYIIYIQIGIGAILGDYMYQCLKSFISTLIDKTKGLMGYYRDIDSND